MRRGIVLFAIAIFFIAGATLSSTTARAAQIPGGIATDPILQPPPYDGQPLEVVIGLHIVNIAAIDEVSEQFHLDAYMFERWKDPRLAYSPEGPQDQMRNYAFGQIWVPQLEMINAATPRAARRNFDHGEPGWNGEVRRTHAGKAFIKIQAQAFPVR